MSQNAEDVLSEEFYLERIAELEAVCAAKDLENRELRDQLYAHTNGPVVENVS